MPVEPSRVRPSLAWLALAALPVVAGIAIAVLLFVDALGDATESFTPLNGPRTVQLEAGEGRGIWARTAAEVSGSCSVLPRPKELKDTNGVTVTTGGVEYHSFLRFRARDAGRYTVNCAASQPLSLGPYLTAGRLVAAIGGILGSFFGGFLLGGVVVAVVLLGRERSKRRLELEAQALR